MTCSDILDASDGAEPADDGEVYEPVPGLFQRSEDGLWIGRASLPDDGSGKRRYRQVSSKDHDTAVGKLAELRAGIEAGIIGAAVTYTVAGWLTHWLDVIHTDVIRPGTKRRYRSIIDNHITPHIGARRLDKLTRDDIRRMHRLIPTTASALRAHQILQRALRDAVREDVLTANVADAVHPPPHVITPRTALNVTQATHLIRHCRDTSDPHLLRWMIAFLTGARQGEALGLCWDHVDLEHDVIDFAWQLQRLPEQHACGPATPDGTWPCGRKLRCLTPTLDVRRGFEYRCLHRNLCLVRPKTKAGVRVFPISAPLHDLLAAVAGDATGPNPHRLLFHHSDGRPIAPWEDRRNWHAALAAADLPAVALHTARATAATTMLAAGVDEQTRMALFGHVSIKDQRLYARLDADTRRTAITSLTAIAEGHP